MCRTMRILEVAVCMIAILVMAHMMTLAQSLPDLTPDVTDWKVELNATVSPGDVAEGCAASTSGVDLLRFSVEIWNEGSADLYLGDPMCPRPCSEYPLAVCGNPLYICSPAGGHNHGHYTDFARYELLDPGGQTVLVGRKQGYCLRDSICSHPKYICRNQGITAGCGDVYDADLGCQYLDVTNVPGGAYMLRVTVDPLEQVTESKEDNNSVTVAVIIPDRGGTQTPVLTPSATDTPSNPDLTPTATPSSADVTPTDTPVPTMPAPPASPTPILATAVPPTSTPTPGASPVVACAGDCDGNGTVTIVDLLLMTNIALDIVDVQACMAGDVDGNGAITVDEIVVAVANALEGCPRS